MRQTVCESMIVAMNSQGSFWKRYGSSIPANKSSAVNADLCSPLFLQRLMGASLLIFLNKTDVEGCMAEDEVRQVSKYLPPPLAGYFERVLIAS